MSTDPYFRNYTGPRDPAVYQQWLAVKYRNFKRRMAWGAVIGAALGVIFIFAVIAASGN
jgi:hypothetical protein